MNTYAIVIDPDLDVHTIRVENIDPKDSLIGMFNISEWLGSTEMGRYEFAPDTAFWFASVNDDLNLVGTSFLGNRKTIYGNIVITTWTRRGIDCKGIPETNLPEVWGWIEEAIAVTKNYMKMYDKTLQEVRDYVEQDIRGENK